MFYPTLIIVNNNNRELKKLGEQLSESIRVVHRSSFEGETLYSTGLNTLPFIEGVIYFDKSGSKKFIRRDNYSDVYSLIKQDLANLNPNEQQMLQSYIKYNNEKARFESTLK